MSYTPYIFNPMQFQRFQVPVTMALRNPYNGRYLCAQFGSVYSALADFGTNAHFLIQHLGNGIVELKALFGQLVAVAPNGGVYLSPTHMDYDTKFYMEFYGNMIAFRTMNYGLYLAIDMYGNVRGENILTQDCEFQEVDPMGMGMGMGMGMNMGMGMGGNMGMGGGFVQPGFGVNPMGMGGNMGMGYQQPFF